MASIRKERKSMITFAVSDEEKNALIEKARRLDITLSDFCRKILFNATEKEEKDG